MTNLFILKPEGKATNSRRLRVFYGWSKLNSVRKRKAISVIFENARQSEARSLNFISRMQETVYIRYQTESEALDGFHCNRMFTEYSVFMDSMSVNGSLDAALKENMIADSKNLTQPELDAISDKLRHSYRSVYK